MERYGDRTLFHDVEGREGSTKVIMRSGLLQELEKQTYYSLIGRAVRWI
jgi:hypothetical protein